MTIVLSMFVLTACGEAADAPNTQPGAEAEGDADIPAQPPSPSCDSEHCYVPAPPEPGTDIPSDAITLGFMPSANNAFYIIAIENGWFGDVGVEVEPFQGTVENLIPLVTRNEVNVGAGFAPMLVALTHQSDAPKMIMYHNDFLALAILGNPDLGDKTVRDYLDEGLSFEAALKEVLTPIKDIAIPPNPNSQTFLTLAFETAGLPLPEFRVMPEEQNLLLARRGELNYSSPTGGIILEIMRLGWPRLVGVDDMIENMPYTGPEDPVQQLIGSIGLQANPDWVTENPNTTLRVVSVVFRMIDSIMESGTFPSEAAAYVNSYIGTELTPDAIYEELTTLIPMAPWDVQNVYWEDAEDARYYKNSAEALINKYQQDDIVPPGDFVADDVIWGGQIFSTLKWYQQETDRILGTLEGESLSSEATTLVEQARQHYEWYNFLDAFRFARAAASIDDNS